MRDDESEPADPEGVFRNGARVGGNIIPTREDSFPIALLEKVDEVANRVNSSLT